MGHKVHGEETLRKYFDQIKNTVKFKTWYFGHFHIDWSDYDVMGQNFRALYYDKTQIQEIIKP